VFARGSHYSALLRSVFATISLLFARGDTDSARLGGLYARLCHTFLVVIISLLISFKFLPGKDPLLDKLDGKDINSVAGVLKLYFRELKDPLFPFHMFDDLIACSTNCNFNSQFSSLRVPSLCT